MVGDLMLNTRIVALLSLATLTACGPRPPLTPAGEEVKVKTVEPEGCEEVGMIYARDGHRIGSLRNAHNDLRNKVAEVGGNVAVIDSTTNDDGDLQISGRAFRCSL